MMSRLLSIVLKSKVTKMVVSLDEHWFAIALAIWSESGGCTPMPFKDAETVGLKVTPFLLTKSFSKVTK